MSYDLSSISVVLCVSVHCWKLSAVREGNKKEDTTHNITAWNES